MKRLFFLSLAFASVACSGEVGQTSDEAALSNPDYGYFAVRADLRKCAYPTCGGYFVHRVNTSKTLCTDGGYAAECYVASVDLSGTGLTSDEQSAIDVGHSVVRGKIAKTKINGKQFGRFDASEAWVGQTGSNATGAVYRAKDDGIKCIKAPCPTIGLVKLDTTTKTKASGLDLASTENAATQQQIDDADGDLFASSGLVVAGAIQHENDGGTTLVASEFYRLAGTHACGSKGMSACASDEYCAYDSKAQCGAGDQPGVCTARPAVCYQLYMPVCGCDGSTYTNDCFAKRSGTSVAHTGACN